MKVYLLIGRFITTAELAKRWGVSEGTLRNQRNEHRGPEYEKVGKHVLYNLDVIFRWEEKHKMKVINEP